MIEQTMEWLPPVHDFRERLKQAVAAPLAEVKLEQLAALAAHRLSFLEVLQLDRTLLSVALTSSVPGFAKLRVALVGSATLNHLEPGIRVAGLRHRQLFDIRTGAYGQYRNEILDKNSFLHEFRPQMVLLSVTARDAIGVISLSASVQDVDERLARAVADLRYLWRSIGTSLKAQVIQQTFLDLELPLFGSFDRTVPAAPMALILRLNERISEAAREDGVLLVDIAARGYGDGLGSWFDARHWLQAKQEVRPEASPYFGELLARVVTAQRGASRKCLVLDLDNTLWGGVIGDDGLEGIVLGQGSAVGEAHLALQQYALCLKERGVILAVCSKNDPTIAEAAFRDHPDMLLKRSDFSAFVANWGDKSNNLLLIAKQLNIGIDSLVFVDDNPVERARVRESLPLVAVPELPNEPAYYARTLAAAGYFESVSFTREDQERAELYSKNAERSAALSSAMSIDEFLESLNMKVLYGPFSKNDLPRAVQLINKTNQFNTTSRRYSADEVHAKAVAPDHITLQFRLQDKFGDNGLVSTMIVSQSSERPEVLELENWVMSCRVFGRGLEYEAMNILVESAKVRNASAILAEFIPTAKNGVIEHLFEDLGFSPVPLESGSNGPTRWKLDVATYSPHETRIVRIKR